MSPVPKDKAQSARCHERKSKDVAPKRENTFGVIVQSSAQMVVRLVCHASVLVTERAMHHHDRLLQRFHDGELSQGEAVGLRRLLSERPELQATSQRFDALHALLQDHSAEVRGVDIAVLEARIRHALPLTPPKREVQVSVVHIITAVVLASFVGLAVMVADQLSDVVREIVPVWSLAVISATCGLVMLLAARPLVRLEAGMFNRLLRRRLSVGDGEVLVCRVLGVALMVGGAHMAGVWG